MTSQTLNGAQAGQAALKGSDREAFVRLLSSMLKAGINADSFEHGPITPDPANSQYATTSVKVDRSNAHISLWGYQDSVPIRYRRIPLSALKTRFGGVIRADLPATKRELMAIYFGDHELHDRSSQILDEPVTDLGEVTMTVTENQFLLYGEASYTVKPFQRQLATVLTETTLPGFRTLVDFDPAPQELMINQMQAANQVSLPFPLEPELISFGLPEKISGYALDNTQIVATYGGDGFYLGQATLVYSRLDFGWRTEGNQHYMEGPSTPTTQFMIDQVSRLTGFPISLNDVTIEAYAPIASGQLETLTVFFKPECLRYTGELTIDYRAL